MPMRRRQHPRVGQGAALSIIGSAIITVQEIFFGNKDCIRLSYATSEEALREALRRIKEAVTC